MPMVRDARVTGPISRAVCHHEPVRAVDSISLPTFIELLKNHPLVREKKVNSFPLVSFGHEEHDGFPDALGIMPDMQVVVVDNFQDAQGHAPKVPLVVVDAHCQSWRLRPDMFCRSLEGFMLRPFDVQLHEGYPFLHLIIQADDLDFRLASWADAAGRSRVRFETQPIFTAEQPPLP